MRQLEWDRACDGDACYVQCTYRICVRIYTHSVLSLPQNAEKNQHTVPSTKYSNNRIKCKHVVMCDNSHSFDTHTHTKYIDTMWRAEYRREARFGSVRLCCSMFSALLHCTSKHNKMLCVWIHVGSFPIHVQISISILYLLSCDLSFTGIYPVQMSIFESDFYQIRCIKYPLCTFDICCCLRNGKGATPSPQNIIYIYYKRKCTRPWLREDVKERKTGALLHIQCVVRKREREGGVNEALKDGVGGL